MKERDCNSTGAVSAILPTESEALLGLVEDMMIMDLKQFAASQLQDLARMARQLERAAEEESRRRNRPMV